MKNIEIVAAHTVTLIENGTISENGVINTVIGWNARGYKVKKGAEHIAEFSIWMKNKKKKEELSEEELKDYKEFILTTAYWFTNEQVEPFTEEDRKRFKRGGKR